MKACSEGLSAATPLVPGKLETHRGAMPARMFLKVDCTIGLASLRDANSDAGLRGVSLRSAPRYRLRWLRHLQGKQASAHRVTSNAGRWPVEFSAPSSDQLSSPSPLH